MYLHEQQALRKLRTLTVVAYSKLLEKSHKNAVGWMGFTMLKELKEKLSEEVTEFFDSVFASEVSPTLAEVRKEAGDVSNVVMMLCDNIGCFPEQVLAPKIVCLCGSTRFWKEYQKQNLKETLAGNIVLSIGAASGTDAEHFANLSREEYDAVKIQLDELHKRKIDLADEILVLNVDGYIGESTRSEINYAIETSKHVRYLEEIV